MHYRKFIWFALISVAVISCKQHPPTDLAKENLIPMPVSVTATAKVFELTKGSGVYIEGESQELKPFSCDRYLP